MKQINLKIFKMSCEGCTNVVKNTLEKFPGVKKVEVNLMPPEAKILCEDDIIPFDIIKHLEKNTHYQALVNIEK